MKRSILLVLLLVLLLVAAGLAPMFQSDPGHVLINLGEWTVETSVLVLVGAFVLLWFTVQLLAWIWRMPAETARKMREERAVKQLEKGLLALTEGDWLTAEKALEKSASAQGRTTAHYLAAAQAADSQDAPERREYYLEQADSGGSKRHFLVELTRARMLLSNRQSRQAIEILERLQGRRKKHPQVLELLSKAYREAGEWEGLRKLLPALIKADVLSEDQAADLQDEVLRQSLATATDEAALQAAWKQVPKSMRQVTSIVETFAKAAARLEKPELAEPVIIASLKNEWNPALVLRYSDMGSGDNSKRLKQCEKWLKEHPEDAGLHLALGRLCAAESLWGKAREHMIRSLELEPSSLGYDAFGQLLERQGELEPAMTCFRNALRLSQGKRPEPLPVVTARLTST